MEKFSALSIIREDFLESIQAWRDPSKNLFLQCDIQNEELMNRSSRDQLGSKTTFVELAAPIFKFRFESIMFVYFRPNRKAGRVYSRIRLILF